MPRKEYVMSEEQLKELIAACTPQPAIMLQTGLPMTQQESANRAWINLGKVMGFDGMTARPVEGKSPRYFSAEEAPPQLD